MKDIKELPYAAWLEESIRTLAEEGAETIGIAAILPSGEVYTAYYNASNQDKVILAGNVQMDACFEMVKNNATEILRAAEDQEEEDPDEV